jgi:16S rRNA processing protein RimM
MQEYFEIGKIVNTHGLRGDIKIYPTTDDVKRFEKLSELTIKLNGKEKREKIERLWYHKNMVMMKLVGVDDANAAAQLKSAVIIVPRAEALPLGNDEYYLSDLLGLAVNTQEGEALGTIADVLFTGASDVYIVRRDGVKDILIPAIKDCILNVDIEKKEMTVKLLEGLR